MREQNLQGDALVLLNTFMLPRNKKGVSAGERYQRLALQQRDLGPEVTDGHGDGFPVEAVGRVPH